MKQVDYCLFETPLGLCGIAWSEDPTADTPYAVTLFQLPEATAELTEARIAQNSGSSQSSNPPTPIATIIERVRKHLQGELQDFRNVPVDLADAGPFVQKVCVAARKIPAGKTTTYAALASAMGRASMARAVGRALGKNPIPLIIHCHRVLAAGDKPGGFSAHGGRATKARLLAIEGTVVNLYLELESSPKG